MKRLSRCFIAMFKKIFGTETHLGKINPKNIKRVLLMGNDKLGDSIVLTPVFNLLNVLNDEIEIDCIGYDASYEALLGDKRLTRVYRYKQDFSIFRLCRHLRKREYDLILSLTWRKGLREGLLAVWASVKKTIRVTIYRKPKYAPFWNKMIRVPTWVHHTADKYLHLLAQILDAKRFPSPKMSIDIRSDSKSRVEKTLSNFGVQEFILLNLSAGESEMTQEKIRCWTREQYAQLILKLRDVNPNFHFVILSLPQDAKHAQWIQMQRGGKGIFLFPTTLNIHDVIALASKAKMLISPDTSLIHIASAVGTPTVGLFSNRGKIESWGSYNVPNRMLAASPNDYRMTPLSKITVEKTLEATLHLMKEL